MENSLLWKGSLKEKMIKDLDGFKISISYKIDIRQYNFMVKS